MKNSLVDLHNHLFCQLERLGDEDLCDEELKKEINRAKAIQGVASQIIGNANLMLRAHTTVDNATRDMKLPELMLKGEA